MELQILSAVQFQPRLATCRADIMDNFRRMEPLIRQAGALGTSFLVFPELCLTGYSFLSKEQATEVAELPNGPTYLKMRGVAQALSSYVSYGYVEYDPIDGALYNSATMLDPSGKPITSYQKVNLFSTDFLWATPGLTPAPVVKTEFGRTGLVVCRDLRDKLPTNIPRKTKQRVASEKPLFDGHPVDLVAACVNWGKGGFPANSWMDFAADNNCTLVVANRYGNESRDDFSQEFGIGGSAIIESDWNVHTGGLLFNADCVVTAALESPIAPT